MSLPPLAAGDVLISDWAWDLWDDEVIQVSMPEGCRAVPLGDAAPLFRVLLNLESENSSRAAP